MIQSPPLYVHEVTSALASLMKQSKVHKGWSDDEIVRLTLPAASTGQFALFDDGFLTWAWLSEEAQEAFITGHRKLQYLDWQSGNNLWVIDLVMINGAHPLKLMREFKSFISTNTNATVCKFRRRKADGTIVIKEMRHGR